jgi:hypothetical protein
MRRIILALAGLALAVAALPGAAGAAPASPAPAHTPYRIDVTKIQPKSLLPKNRLHDDFIVAINNKGQVTRVLSGHRSGNTVFDEHMYGNALQMFIRTGDGHVVLGKYRVNYDYDPHTTRIRRTIALVSTGGVDPNAIGAVYEMLRHAHKEPAPVLTAPPNANNINGDDLPALNEVFGASPTPH